MNNTFVSVIIPLYKDWERLRICLQGLADQNYPSSAFEVIVVNNYPADEVPADLALATNCCIIKEKIPGSYAARNAGIRAAKGNVFAFTDSDCIPDPDWIKNAVACLEENKAISRIAGKVGLFYSSDTLTNVELYEQVFAFNQDIYVKNDGTGVTANLFSRREVFNAVGLFNEQLMSGGDYEWGTRAQAAGYRICYAEDVLVRHPARFKMEELVRKAKRVGGGQAVFMNGRKTGLPGAALRFLYDLRPPLKGFRLIYSKGKHLSFRQQLIIGLIRYYLSLVSACERFSVRTGKKANRV